MYTSMWYHLYYIQRVCKIQNFLRVRVHTKKFKGDESKHWQLRHIFLCFHFCSFTVHHRTASGLIFLKVKHIQWLSCAVHPGHYHNFLLLGWLPSFSTLLYFSPAAHSGLLSQIHLVFRLFLLFFLPTETSSQTVMWLFSYPFNLTHTPLRTDNFPTPITL